MVGHVTVDYAIIWVQSYEQQDIQVQYKVKSESDWLDSEVEKTLEVNYFTAKLKLKTEFNKNYEYRILTNGQLTTLTGEFRTPPLPSSSDLDFSFAMGSCVYINDEHIPVKGDDYYIFESIAEKQPDIMLWTGDNVYLQEMDWHSEHGMAERYSKTRDVQEMDRLLSGTANYATWDDHDYGPNDSDRGYIGKELSLNVFDLFWANPEYDLDKQKVGTRTAFSWGDTDFFLLDNRYFRSPQKRQTGERTILGKEQLEWLIDALSTSEATFKFVVVGGLVLSSSDSKLNQNYISNYSSERTYLLDQIELNNIKNVVFLTGDKHFSEVSKMDLRNGNTIWEVTSSPLTANPNTREDLNRYRLEGSLIQQRNFAKIDVHGKKGERKLTITLYDSSGQNLWSTEVSQQ